MNFLAMAAAYLGAPAKGGVLKAPTRTEVGLSLGMAAAIAGGIVLVALALKKG